MGNNTTVLITAAGSGSRMGHEKGKLFLKIGSKTVIERTLEVFDKIEKIQNILLVIREQDKEAMEEITLALKKPVKLVIGGSSREESTYNGLKVLEEDCDIVVCHDGARPFIRRETIEKCLEEIEKYEAVIVAVPVKDTIKCSDHNGMVDYTPNREFLYQVQTPQVFRKNIIKEAYEINKEENIKVTDDSSLVEKLGKKVKIVLGDYTNIKITTKEDLFVGEKILDMEEKK